VSALRSMAVWDVRLQFRYGFYAVYAIVTAVYALGLTQLPPGFVIPALVLAVVTDSAVLGFYFIGALVLIEKREGVIDALVVSPLGVRGYLLSKTVSLTLLAVLASTSVALLVHPRVNLPVFVAAVALTAVLFVLIGFAAVARFDAINDYFLSAVFYGTILYAPLFGFLGVVETPLFVLLPTQPALVLVNGAFGGLGVVEAGYGFGYLALGCVGAFALARREFERRLVRGEGAGGAHAPGHRGWLSRHLGDRTGPVGGLVLADLRNWTRDPILLIAAGGPLALALLARFALPVAAGFLPGVPLAAYYPLALGFVVIFPPYIYGTVIGFLVLEDREQQVLDALRTTPLTARGYLRYRGATAYVVSAALGLCSVPVFGLVPVPLPVLLPVVGVVSLGAPAVTFLFAGLARDAIEGVTINKLLGFVVLVPVAAVLFLPVPVQYLAGIDPLYWPLKALLVGLARGVTPSFVALLGVGAGSLCVAILVFARRFERLTV
jgi:hypothetical protein